MNREFIMLVYSIIVILALLGAGYYSKKFVTDTSDFIIAGRSTSLPINAMGIMAIGFAGTAITLAPGFTIQYGLFGGFAWGILYAALGLILYGLIFSKFVRLNGAQTLPEYFEMRFGPKVRTVVAITSVLGMTGILANNIVSLTNYVGGYTGWPSWAIMGVAFVVILVFATTSGMWATNLTDFIQVGVGAIGVPVFLLMLMSEYGGFDFIAQNWASGTDWFSQGISGQSLPVTSFQYPSILTFILTFAAALVWGNNYYWIKLATARNEKVARNSYVFGGLLLVIIFLIPLSLIGAYAGAVMPEEFTLLGGALDQTAAYGLIAQVITPLLGSLFIIAAAGAAISTSSTSALGATSTASRDIYQQIINPDATSEQQLKSSRWIMVLIILLTWVMTFFPGGPTYLFAFANAWLTPPAVLVFLGASWPRYNKDGAFWGVLAGMVSMLILTILQITGIWNVGQYTHIAIVGFVFTLIVSVLVTLVTESPYYADPNWKQNISKDEQTIDSLDTVDEKVLTLIGLGHKYMSDITDALQVDSKISNSIIERLEKAGYIEREGRTWTSFYTFKLTEKGEKIGINAPHINNDMRMDHVNETYLNFMKVIDNPSFSEADYQKENNIGSLQLSSIITHLSRINYIQDSGVYQRKLRLTDEGRRILNKYN